MNKLSIGIVSGFDESRGWGSLRVKGEPQEVDFSLDGCSDLVATHGGEIVFGEKATKFSLPQVGAHVVCLLSGIVQPKVSETSRGLCRVVTATAWNYYTTFQDCRKQKGVKILKVEFSSSPTHAEQPLPLSAFFPRHGNESDMAYKIRFRRFQNSQLQSQSR